MIVGWRVAAHIRTEMVLDAIEMAGWSRGTKVDGLRCHSDAGSQLTSLRYDERLAELGATPSIEAVADSYDALAETTVGSFKTELIRRHGPWRDVDHVEIETLNWVHFFNTERPHEYLDDLTPEAAEALHYARKNQPANAG